MSIQFLFFEGCPSHDDALHRLKTVMAEEGIHADIDIINVETEEQALALHFARDAAGRRMPARLRERRRSGRAGMRVRQADGAACAE